MVIEVLPLHIFIIGGRYIWVQEFIILNEEYVLFIRHFLVSFFCIRKFFYVHVIIIFIVSRMRPMIFAMWEDFLESEGMHLVQIANEHPVVLICRPKVSRLYGELSILFFSLFMIINYLYVCI